MWIHQGMFDADFIIQFRHRWFCTLLRNLLHRWPSSFWPVPAVESVHCQLDIGVVVVVKIKIILHRIISVVYLPPFLTKEGVNAATMRRCGIFLWAWGRLGRLTSVSISRSSMIVQSLHLVQGWWGKVRSEWFFFI